MVRWSLPVVAVLAVLPLRAATIRSGDGLSLDADLPGTIAAVSLDGHPLSAATGGFTLTDPRTGQPPAAGTFTIAARVKGERERLVIDGTVTAAGDQETVAQLDARIPVGDEGWLFWDNMTAARPLRAGQSYVQTVYPLACVTTADKQRGLAVALDPDPVQPASFSYDPAGKALVVTWRLGFTPLARPELRMRAPFRLELFRLEPGWAFRSGLERYYRFHPDRFDQRAKFEGLWEFATTTDSLPNPQHYAYNEGGPPTTLDLPRGIHTFPYTCTGDLTIALPVAWGVPKTYEEMLDRLERWGKQPRLADWERISDYELATDDVHTGERSLKLHTAKPLEEQELRQVIPLRQKRVDPVTVTVWTRAQDITGVADTNYGLWLDLVMADGSNQFGRTAAAAVGTHGWQKLSLTVGEDQPIQEIRLYLLLRGQHTGTAWFDDVTVATASQPDRNLAKTPGFESAGPPPELQFLRDNVMYDAQDHYRYAADTWGGADVGPASPINWLRFLTLVNADQRNPDGRPTEVEKDLKRIDGWFAENPDCAGIYMDGTSACTTTTVEYRRDFFGFFRDPFTYEAGVFRPCANGMASVIRYVDAYKERYRATGKLAFGNVWASNRMFPVCMALDVPGYESSRWYDPDYADYYRAALSHKPGLYLNYFRIGQQLDTREGGERFFRYATAYGLFPSIGRYTDEAYQKFGDLQHRYIPIVKHLFRAGWEPVTHAVADDPEVRVQRFGTRLPIYLTVLNPTPHPRLVRLSIDAAQLGLHDTPEALEMVTSASLRLTRQGDRLLTDLPLGPQDVAVVTLLPADGAGAWYRERAAEHLAGAALVYAGTPPTNAAADLAQRVRRLEATRDAGATARAVEQVELQLGGLNPGPTVPEDAKQLSFRREVSEARRLLAESLLADTGSRVGWTGRAVVPADQGLTLRPEVKPAPGGKVAVTWCTYSPGRLVEPAGAPGLPVGPAVKRPEPATAAVTYLADLEFTDAAGRSRTVDRIGYGWFGDIAELAATYSAAAGELTVRLRNLDAAARPFHLELTAPDGLTLTPASADVRLGGGEGTTTVVKATFAERAAPGRYPVQVALRLAGGEPVAQTTVDLPRVVRVEAGDLALPATGAQVAVDSAYYAYSAKPINDGVVDPVGMAFNEGAWAAAETADDHWVQLTWPAPQTVGRVVVYWNLENEVIWTSRHVLIQAKQGDAWQTVAEARPAAGEPVTTIAVPPTTTTALRLLQPKGEGPASRPNILWLRELAVYSR